MLDLGLFFITLWAKIDFLILTKNLKFNTMKRSVIVFISLVFAVSVCNAQIGRNILRSAANQATNTAEDKATEKVNKEVDKGVSKFLDNLMNSADSTKAKSEPQKTNGSNGNGEAAGSQTANSMSKLMKSIGVSTEIPPHKEVYKFTSEMVSVTEMTDEKGKKQPPVESTIRFNDKTNDAMFKASGQDANSATIIDVENSCMLVLTESEGSKSGFITKFDPNMKASGKMPDAPQDNNAKVEDECKMTKTGKTKTISGFVCSEYRCETASEISIAWVTKDRSANLNKIFGNSDMGKNYKTEGFDGMAIQYEFYSKTDKSSSIMTIKSIDGNKSTSHSTAGYQFTALNISGAK
jgi:hypothetical protein